MDGAKLVTDTVNRCKASGRQAFCMERSSSERKGGPCGNDDPGNSRNRAE